MSGQPAARTGDMHTCPMVTGLVPHGGGPLVAGQAKVIVGGMPAARLGDVAVCVGPPDSIVKGAFPVPIEMKPAARQTDQTAHGGQIALGCPTVEIGLAGTTGNPRIGTIMCEAAKRGRNPPPGSPPGTTGAPAQSYNNCGVETCRQMINQAKGAGLTEDQLLTWAINQSPPLAGGTPGAPLSLASGGGVPAQRQAILAANGVAAEQIAPTLENMQVPLSQGRPLAADVWAGNLPNPAWASTPAGTGGHTVMVTGMTYDDNGNIKEVIINDTGAGTCGEHVDAGTFRNALMGGGNNHVSPTTPMF